MGLADFPGSLRRTPRLKPNFSVFTTPKGRIDQLSLPSHDETGRGGVTLLDWPVRRHQPQPGSVAELWPNGTWRRASVASESRGGLELADGLAGPVARLSSETEEPGPGGFQCLVFWDFP
jgi:hypothetical protein